MSDNKILIVEDEAVVSLDLSRRLQKMGYEIVGRVASGEAAIAAIEENPPDLALMDINLQGDMDGIETAERLYKEFDIPVIYLTAYAGESTLQRAKQTRPYGYILKPFKERELRATIEIAIARHQNT
ncbi:response regulator receiver protein [Rubidibacter lacunae KORDI 51-2]|uniref:Response regulator receiver protein n=1 Tax=Rubidibacter lacunae KORDI 51-2 TaxID=582515 RepID=U5DQL4_9CHRO|nr:response regulator [Rubidibacter lacunae]ERN41980.1 response regulator receiver protein [Rubidibacter lacunae KORDI 51-2]